MTGSATSRSSTAPAACRARARQSSRGRRSSAGHSTRGSLGHGDDILAASACPGRATLRRRVDATFFLVSNRYTLFGRCAARRRRHVVARSGVEGCEHRVVQQAVRRDELPPSPSPSRTAGLEHDRLDRGVVPECESASTAASSAPSATSTCCQKSPSRARARPAARAAARSRRVRARDARVTELSTAETPIGSPFANAPSPRAAHQRRPSAGAETTPQTTLPSRSSAISVAHTGMPREKFRVPSIGSTIHRTAPPSSPSSSPSTPSPGRSRAMRSRSMRSVARSASVTGVRSGFVSTRRSPARKRGSVSASAASASSSA